MNKSVNASSTFVELSLRSTRIISASLVYLPGDLERQIGAFVDHYNNHRYHESLDNLIPADVYHGRGAKILKMREEIKEQTFRKRRLQHQSATA
jgi:putative transposase